MKKGKLESNLMLNVNYDSFSTHPQIGNVQSVTMLIGLEEATVTCVMHPSLVIMKRGLVLEVVTMIVERLNMFEGNCCNFLHIWWFS